MENSDKELFRTKSVFWKKVFSNILITELILILIYILHKKGRLETPFRVPEGDDRVSDEIAA